MIEKPRPETPEFSDEDEADIFDFTCQLLTTGRPIDADEAYRVGLVDRVVTGDELMPAATELATEISKKSPLGLRYGKQALNEAEFLPVEEGYAREQGYSTRLMHTEDAREATRAVLE